MLTESPSSNPIPLVGSKIPRLWTQPLGRVSRERSHGYQVIEFADAAGVKLLPWQKWALVHGLELNAEGTGYRFRTVLIVVARQNGKTTIAQVLALWRMAQARTLVLGTSTNLETAREAWMAAVELAEDEMPRAIASVKRGSIDTSLRMVNRSRYVVRAANRRGARGLPVDLVIADELREHQTWDGWSAINATTTARPDPQVWCFSNAGDDNSVVLNHLREKALSRSDDTLALFEWSAPEGCGLDDREVWTQANPALGYTITEASLASKLASSTPTIYRTEHLCQRVASMDSVVDMAAWRECADKAPMGGLRNGVATCLDVSLDLGHVTLVAAAKTADDRVRVEVVSEWDSVGAARKALPDLLDQIKPRAFGWFPNGPGATLAADLKDVRNAKPIRAEEISAVCVGLVEQVAGRRVLHGADALLTSQLDGTSRLWSGDGWRFARRGVGHCDAVYATAGAVHLARTLPKPVGKPRLVFANE